MQLFDAHCHLQDARIAGDIPQILERARVAGVRGFLTCGTSEADWSTVAELCKKHPNVSPAFGLHPWWVAERSSEWRINLSEFLNDGGSVGEIGLDYAGADANRREQMSIFLYQYRLSIDLGRTVSVHCRRAWGDMLELLRSHGAHPAGIILHSYSGSAEIIPQLTKLNSFFSFSCALTYPENQRAAGAVRATPIERLLIETDTPDISPRGEDGKRERLNEPANLSLVLRRVAELKFIETAELAADIWENGLGLIHE